jgi:hypothetical protein
MREGGAMERQSFSNRWRVAVVAVVLSLPIVGIGGSVSPSHAADDTLAASDRASAQSCWSSVTPLGALPPAEPMWCTEMGSGPSTFSEADNAWLDAFNHGLTDADIGGGYRVFAGGAGQQFLDARYFRHNDHWMVDVRGRNAPGAEANWGGTVMRPDRGFRYVDGRLVVEADVAAGIAEYAGGAWPEIVVTTAPAPTTWVDPLYTYGQFKGHWTVGCRLQPQRVAICALHGADGARRWEIPQSGGHSAQVFAATPGSAAHNAWRQCAGTDPDLNCRDRFRLELTQDSFTLFVNGQQFLAATGFTNPNEQMGALVGADVYAYFGSWVYRPGSDTVRFHWGHLAVNPGAPPSTASDMTDTNNASAHGH